jgi:hypothetical protein
MAAILYIICLSVLLWAAILLPLGVPLSAFCWGMGFLVLVSFPVLCCLAAGNRKMTPVVDGEPRKPARARKSMSVALSH